MEQQAEDRVVKVCSGILNAARNELYLHMRFLDMALSSLEYEPSLSTERVGTDSRQLFYNPAFLIERYRRDRVLVSRAYLHMVLHCIFRHPMKAEGRLPEYWDLACDVAVESVLDGMDYRSVYRVASPVRQKLYRQLGETLPVLTAEGVYKALTGSLGICGPALTQLSREFLADDHGFWSREGGEQEQQEQGRRWQEIAEKMQTGMEAMGTSGGSEALLEQVRVETRERYDYRRFLKKFAVVREEVKVDPDSFDYVFYTYGLRLYGNMPLVEPQEFREARKIEDFVFVIDTSMSCSGELVHAFLSETYAVLKESESFFKKVNIRILQCDEQVRADRRVTSGEELKAYMEEFELAGGGGTDFRPAFAYVDKLVEERAFRQLKGLIYFTDGLGKFPKKRPGYDVAFVFMRQNGYAPDAEVPPWAIRLVLEPDDLNSESLGGTTI